MKRTIIAKSEGSAMPVCSNEKIASLDDSCALVAVMEEQPSVGLASFQWH